MSRTENTADAIFYTVTVMASKVYFTEGTAPEDALKAFRALGKELPGKIAVKVHTGEEGNQNYLTPISGGLR